MRPTLAVMAAAALAAAACIVGPALENFPPAQSPHGISLDLRLENGRVQGELLEVRDSAYVILHAGRVTLVPYRRVRVALMPAGTVDALNTAPTPAIRERLRLLSRFPQGLTPEIEQRLLETLGQPSLEVIP